MALRVFNSSPSSSACTAQIAIASFWRLLQDDLADLCTAPDGWTTIPHNHPFQGYEFPGLILNLLVDLALPPTL